VNAVEVQTHAHKLYRAQGTRALAEATQMVREFERRGDPRRAEDWRRIAKALQQMRGPNAS
jgi:hypothetical protein